MTTSFWTPRLALLAAGLLMAGPGCPRPAGGREGQASAHWGYSGKTGPRRWGSLGAENALCGQGRAQSPVDLASAAAGGAGPVLLRYNPVGVSASDTGHTIQWDFGPGASMVIDGIDYPLLQVHFHTPAEHRWSGARQAWNSTSSTRPATDGGWCWRCSAGRAGPTPKSAGCCRPRQGDGGGSGETISPGALLPASRAAVRYEGSLTTPPCSEGVSWIVLTEPVELAPEQLDRLRARYSGNARPAQPLNGRPLLTVPDALD